MVLMIANQLSNLRRWMLAFGLALIMTSALSVFAPAVAAFVYLDLTPQVYANISSTVYTHVPTLEALRAGTFRSIPLDNLEGLITFPSFHTAGAIMFIWALRKVPYVRWPAIALNAALIAATPIDGAHYFIDLVGGAVVAFAAIAMSYWYLPVCACRRDNDGTRPRSRTGSGTRFGLMDLVPYCVYG